VFYCELIFIVRHLFFSFIKISRKEKSKDEEYDERYDDAVALITKTRQASISSIQRHLRIGYNRAARIIEVMEREGIVGPSDGAKPRDVLVAGYDDDIHKDKWISYPTKK